MTRPWRIAREVTTEECPWLDETLPVGLVVYEWDGHDYGVVTPSGFAATRVPNEYPFFEVPVDAVEPA